MIPKKIVSSAIAFAPYDDTTDPQTIFELKKKGITPAEYKGKAGKIYKQEWQLVRDDKKVEIYRHLQDGMATFSILSKIAVFFLRRDSYGEGGSGQRWFQESVFEFILEKMIDRGLIVTDGSGSDYTIYNSAPWKSLWAKASCNVRERNKVQKPDDFTCYNRNFVCLGQCGRGYGLVYIWQVTKV